MTPAFPPELAARYAVQRMLGRGAFGEVVLATDRELGREVAIKVLAAAGDAEARARFEREARVTAKVEHPGVVRVYDAGSGQGPRGEVWFIVYEFLDGESLADRLASSGPQPTARVLEWGAALAAALQSAHDAGVLHRDLKPSNVMLRAGAGAGDPVLCDFGLARRLDARTFRTTEGKVVGTFTYMAPELFTGAFPSPAADQYGLAATLYQAASGKKPYTVDQLVAHATGKAPLPAPDPLGLPGPEGATLQAALTRALAPRPEQRFGRAADLAAALRGEVTPGATPAAGAEVVPSSPAPPRPASRGGVLARGLGLAAVAAAAALALRPPALAPRPRPAATPGAEVPLGDAPLGDLLADLEPTGRDLDDAHGSEDWTTVVETTRAHARTLRSYLLDPETVRAVGAHAQALAATLRQAATRRLADGTWALDSPTLATRASAELAKLHHLLLDLRTLKRIQDKELIHGGLVAVGRPELRRQFAANRAQQTGLEDALARLHRDLRAGWPRPHGLPHRLQGDLERIGLPGVEAQRQDEALAAALVDELGGVRPDQPLEPADRLRWLRLAATFATELRRPPRSFEDRCEWMASSVRAHFPAVAQGAAATADPVRGPLAAYLLRVPLDVDLHCPGRLHRRSAAAADRLRQVVRQAPDSPALRAAASTLWSWTHPGRDAESWGYREDALGPPDFVAQVHALAGPGAAGPAPQADPWVSARQVPQAWRDALAPALERLRRAVAAIEEAHPDAFETPEEATRHAHLAAQLEAWSASERHAELRDATGALVAVIRTLVELGKGADGGAPRVWWWRHLLERGLRRGDLPRVVHLIHDLKGARNLAEKTLTLSVVDRRAVDTDLSDTLTDMHATLQAVETHFGEALDLLDAVAPPRPPLAMALAQDLAAAFDLQARAPALLLEAAARVGHEPTRAGVRAAFRTFHDGITAAMVSLDEVECAPLCEATAETLRRARAQEVAAAERLPVAMYLATRCPCSGHPETSADARALEALDAAPLGTPKVQAARAALRLEEDLGVVFARRSLPSFPPLRPETIARLKDERRFDPTAPEAP